MPRTPLLAALLALAAGEAAGQPGPLEAPPPVAEPRRAQPGPSLIESSRFIQVVQARDEFRVTGKGLAVAVLDTGLRVTHADFRDRAASPRSRVVARRNFTARGEHDDVTDADGHGTHAAGIIAADGVHVGIAPGAGVVPLKVAGPDGGDFAAVLQALTWVRENHKKYKITVVALAVGDAGNYASDAGFAGNPVRAAIAALRAERIAVVATAGANYFAHDGKPGMSFPGVCREAISVGAVYDADIGPCEYPRTRAKANTTGPNRIAPFSQRLPGAAGTDVFAPGTPVTSAGTESDTAESIQHGTTQPVPVVAGVILLLQEYHLRSTNELPPVDDLEKYLARGGVGITDGDDEDNNVRHTGQKFVRVSHLGSLQVLQRDLRQRLLDRKPLKK